MINCGNCKFRLCLSWKKLFSAYCYDYYQLNLLIIFVLSFCDILDVSCIQHVLRLCILSDHRNYHIYNNVYIHSFCICIG